ncbi:MarR family winged helix-turn-helix transcriptional regulator [Desulfobaculum bizertense]|uniref:DNA-binding transcriptional regulator, MarR family n=1 Tax=Desulfobaculum bizertense DSM 18034 TaxID=1121442 RepID=A0A1T4WCD7_9BACT|nr:MarR family winged helix-turn-helix transcriptional regulator [Desulfobaculum bizertense]UIJ37415.1 MarR family winged helix-turn-helix transcriptional regulator [Desulfobaculum bizertense]SKA74972.1 DNA-binding transcriptional regulator, MarR family [Desulfobaculum bizertense DSM 18034]
MVWRRDGILGRCISVCNRVGMTYVGRQLSPLGIGKGQFMHMAELYYEDGISQEELAGRLYMDKGTVARALGHLENKGYIEKRADAKDARKKLIFLTEKAKKLEGEFIGTLIRCNVNVTENIPDEELQTCISVLQRVAKNMESSVNDEPLRKEVEEG